MLSRRLIPVAITLWWSVVGIVLTSSMFVYAQLHDEPNYADGFDFPLGAPDGEGYTPIAGFGIQNRFLEDRETCFVDLDGTHRDPEINTYEGDHIGFRELFHAGTDWRLSDDPAGTEGDVVTAS